MSVPANRLAPIILLLWAAAATAWVAMGMLSTVTIPPPFYVGGGVVLGVLCILLVPGFAAWLSALDIRALLALHLVRFVGFYFLWLASVGRLEPFFARTAGIGDAIAAVGALLLILIPALRSRKILLAWNIFGLADILFVVVNAARLFFTAPEQIGEFFHLPLGLLPTFIVPWIIVSHLVIFGRSRTTP